MKKKNYTYMYELLQPFVKDPHQLANDSLGRLKDLQKCLHHVNQSVDYAVMENVVESRE